MMERPDPGFYITRYPPATFWPCRQHLRADTVVVLVVTEDGAHVDEPVCAECGREVLGPRQGI